MLISYPSGKFSRKEKRRNAQRSRDFLALIDYSCNWKHAKRTREMVCQVLDYLILEANKLRNAIPKVRVSTPTREHPAPNSDGLVDEDDLYTSPPPAQPKRVSGIRQLPNSDNEEQEEIIANSSSTLTSTPVSSTQLPSTQFDAPPALTHPRSPQENPSHASQTPSSPLTNISTEDQPPPPKRSRARKPMEVERRPLSTRARGNKN